MKQEFRVVVGAVIYDNKNRFLLAKGHPKDESLPDFWATPAGHVEATKHEPDILEKNLIREVKEEIGVEIKIVDYLESHVWVDKEYTKITAIFLCQIKKGTPKPLDDTSEVKWFTLNEIKKLKTPPNVLRFLTKAQKYLNNKHN